MSEPLLRVPNHHAVACGDPPIVESDSKVEERLDSLEQQVRFLMEQIQSAPASSARGQRDWRKSVGMFKDRPVMKETDAEGQRIREEDRERTANDHS